MNSLRLIFVTAICMSVISCSDPYVSDELLPRPGTTTEPGGETPPVDPPAVDFPEHPRLLMLKGEEETVKTYLSDEFWQKTNDYVVATAGRFITQDLLKDKADGVKRLDAAQKAVRKLSHLAYSYRMTGENKYLEAAEKEMLNLCDFKDWNPSHFLDDAEMTFAVSLAFDWCHDGLSEETRDIIGKAIVDKGLMPSMNGKYNGFLNASTNWNEVCNAGMLYGAIAAFEYNPEVAQQIIDRSATSLKSAMERIYRPDGAYPEGSAYWDYGSGYSVMAIAALEKLFNDDRGLSAIPGFLKSASYALNSIGTVRRFNYSDGGDGGVLSNVRPQMFWFAGKLNDFSVLWEEKKCISKAKGDKYLGNNLAPLALVIGGGVSLDQINVPSQLMYRYGGSNPVCMMRSSWEDANGGYLAMKLGKADINHGHMDVGSFVMEANGQRWASDLGTPSDYSKLESLGDIWEMSQDSFRWKEFRYNNYSHNTLTVNGKLHAVDAMATFKNSSAQEDFMNAVSDLTPLFGGDVESSLRGVALVDKKYALVQDEVKAPANKNATVKWTMAVEVDKVEISSDGKSVKLSRGKKPEVLNVHLCTSRDGIKWEKWNVINEHSLKLYRAASMISFEAEVQAGSSETFRVYLVPDGVDYDDSSAKPLSNWPKD